MGEEKSESTVLRLALKVVELWLSSCRTVFYGHDDSKRLLGQGQVIVALWHCSLIYCLYHFRKHPAAIMVSGSKDGEWVARALRIWGQYPVRGSKLKGGLAAIKKMAKMLGEKRIHAGIVADGSKGPPCIAQIGAVVLARNTGCPIVPVGISARPAYYFNSWDRLMLPMPFSKVAVVYGPPLYVPDKTKGIELEQARILLERELNKASMKANRLCRQ